MNDQIESNLNRRQFLHAAGLAATALAVGLPDAAQAGPDIEVLETRIVSREPQYYHGWPTLTRRRNGDLLLVCSGGREEHVCPFGRVELMVSHDSGQTWCWPQVLMNSPIDTRDAGVLETAKGSLLVTSFTSLAYEETLAKARQKKTGEPGAWPASRLEAWDAANNRINASQRHAELGEWMIRSTDGGITWSARYPTIVNSPHGPVQLADGRLLYAGKELWTKEHRVGVCESLDDGQSWRWLAAIPARPGDNLDQYHELHAVETGDGRIIVHIRSHNQPNPGEFLQTESADGGKNWSVPRTIGVWGLEPSFLLRLRNGKLLMTYGYRRVPYGNQARLSDDEGRTWSQTLIISGDGSGMDLGYPSTVEFDNGSLLTAWYETMRGSNHAVLRQARWRLKT
jgi:hypothetical protein